ncbi:MAG TPA: TAXI family TRAP transporter solute-binding subunit, partial [Dongiaceae bacterium]
ADMAAMAAAGKGPFKSVGPDSDLRAIATVGDTALQVIVPDKSAIRSFADLKGKRIGISAIEADGTISVNQILTALGVVGKKTKLVPLSVADAAAGLVSGNLDAIAIMDRVNLPEITGISDHMAVRLISISVADSEKIGTDRHDFILAHLPVGTDHSATPIDTLIVPILFVVTAKTEESVAFDLARTLVVPKRGTKTTANPAASSPGAHIESTVIPLHSGVQRLLNSTN